MAVGGWLDTVERGRMAPGRRPGTLQRSSRTTLESAAAQARRRVMAPPVSGPHGGGSSGSQVGAASHGKAPPLPEKVTARHPCTRERRGERPRAGEGATGNAVESTMAINGVVWR
jgi:hypothetical protein